VRFLRNFNLSRVFSAASGDPGAVEELVRRLTDGDESTRVHAAEFLGVSGDRLAVEPLIARLHDEKPSVRAVSASALANLGDRRVVGPLIEALSDPIWGEELRFVAKALGDLGDQTAVGPLISALEHKNGQVRSFAATALARLGDPRAIPPLIDLLEGDGPRGMVALALAEFGQPAVDPLTKLLRDPDKDVRLFAADALLKIGDPAAADPLSQLLGDEHILVREKAIQGLVKIGPAAVPFLVKTLEFGQEKALVSAIEALGELGDPRAIEPLRELLDHENARVRAGAEAALAKLVS
jgi:HEAT repeat protein